jgi:type IV pilus assembly protein PilB
VNRDSLTKLEPSLFHLLSSTFAISTTELAKFSNFTNEELFSIAKNKFQINETLLLQNIAQELDLEFKSISQIIIDQSIFSTFEPFLQENCFIPIYQTNETIGIAIDNPYAHIITQLHNLYQKQIKIILITSFELNNYFQNIQLENNPHPTILDSYLIQAIQKNASDIHFCKHKDSLSIKFRINGSLHHIDKIDDNRQKQLIATTKLHAGLDIDITKKPQDGRFSFNVDTQSFNIRISSIPTIHGEDLVIRLFNTQTNQYDLNKIGFTSEAKNLILKMLAQPSGLILVTGPTNSGKTTSLYSFLKQLAPSQKNIISLEDPVEAIFPDFRQSQINLKAGYDFPNGLRAILRQDPDIIMVGEIRDKNTAQIAFQAAYTGHLVFSTLHTNNCLSSLMRLITFEIDPFIITHSLKGIISQHLLPKVCQACKTKDPTPYFQAPGCSHCAYTGYEGRQLLSEILYIQNQNTSYDLKQNFASFIAQNEHYSLEHDSQTKLVHGLILQKDAQHIVKSYYEKTTHP